MIQPAYVHGQPASVLDRLNGDTVEVADTDGVELHVTDMPLGTVLRLLSVKSSRNIVASPGVKGTVTADLYNATFDEALTAVLTANNCGHVTRGEFIFVYTNEEMASLKIQQNPIAVRVFTLNYLTAGDVAPVLAPMLSKEGRTTLPGVDGTGGAAAAADDAAVDGLATHDFIVVYDYPENLDRIADVIGQIDVRPQQVLIEATILRARLTDDNALGVDFSLLAGVDLELLNSSSAGVQNLVFGNLPNERFELFNANASTDFIDNIADGGLTFGVIKDHVALFIKALESVSDTTVMANPKVLALNKQQGNIIVGRRDGYLTTTVTETQAVQKVEFLETGTQLSFRPLIGTDGYVRMQLKPEDSVGGLTAAQLPFEQTTEVTTNIIVKDGHTILIGGLFREVTAENREQVPFAGDIPVLGNLFRSRSDELDREEVIILLTVHVIKDEEHYAQASAEHFREIERVRVGMRSGMMWHGRERLANDYYRKALSLYNDGVMDKAAWNVQMALHNNPRMVPAIGLKDRIEGSRGWEHEGSISRTFIYDLIRREQGMEGDLFQRGQPVEPTPAAAPEAPNGDQDSEERTP